MHNKHIIHITYSVEDCSRVGCKKVKTWIIILSCRLHIVSGLQQATSNATLLLFLFRLFKCLPRFL